MAGLLEAGEPPAIGLVNNAAWEAHAKELSESSQGQPAGYQAVLTCYNGQTVHAVSGQQRTFVTGMIPVVGDGKNGAVGYQPVSAVLQEGAALQITPMTTTRGTIVVLDVHSRVVRLVEKPSVAPEKTKLFGMDVEKIASAAQGPSGWIDQPLLANHHLETTLRVPAGHRMLVGGMTFQAQPKPGEPGLYLFVKPTVRELRDDDSQTDAKPRTD